MHDVVVSLTQMSARTCRSEFSVPVGFEVYNYINLISNLFLTMELGIS